MSLILEALRRSEAQRRRATPPSLLGESAPPRSRGTAAWPMALGGMAIGLGLAALAIWGGGWRPATAASEPAAMPAPPAALPPADPPPEPVPPAAYAPSRAALPRAAPTPAVVPVPEPAPVPAAPGPAATASARPDAAHDVAANPPTPADPGLGPRDGDLSGLDIAGLDAPPLRVSMHVYADDPSRRFAIVDGQRRREGDTLHPGWTLLEIRRDGLRVGVQGQVLWVPR